MINPHFVREVVAACACAAAAAAIVCVECVRLSWIRTPEQRPVDVPGEQALKLARQEGRVSGFAEGYVAGLTRKDSPDDQR